MLAPTLTFWHRTFIPSAPTFPASVSEDPQGCTGPHLVLVTCSHHMASAQVLLSRSFQGHCRWSPRRELFPCPMKALPQNSSSLSCLMPLPTSWKGQIGGSSLQNWEKSSFSDRVLLIDSWALKQFSFCPDSHRDYRRQKRSARRAENFVCFFGWYLPSVWNRSCPW